jgi:uncharacterized protein
MRTLAAASSLPKWLLSAALVALPLALPCVQDPGAKAPAAAARPGESADPAKEKKVRELLALTGAGKIGQQTMKGMLDALSKMPGLPAGFVDKFTELAKPEELVELIVPIYMKHVATEDLDPLLAFWKSDLGRRWLGAQEVIVKESMEAGQKWGADLGARAQRELEAGKKK